MKYYSFDIEANGLLDTITQVHCMTISDGTNRTQYRPHQIEEGLRVLLSALEAGDCIAGQNIIGYDIPALSKVYPWFQIKREHRPQVFDTLVASRLIYANIKDWDLGLFKRGVLPGKLIGSYSLEAWGYRLGVLKGDFAKSGGADVWAVFTEEMLQYNDLDVTITEMLVQKLLAKDYPPEAIQLEHDAQWLMQQQERNGFPFDTQKALELEAKLRGRKASLEAQLLGVVPPIPDKIFTPKRSNAAKGWVAGVPMQRFKEFNPNSRQQIEWLMRVHYSYLPDNEDLFEDGRLKIDDETFKFVKEDQQAPEELRNISHVLEEFLMVSKRLGQLIDGSQGWLKKVKADGCIHGSVNPCGAVTGRATHSNPNMTQVPSGGAPYGHECRELFHVPDGWIQVGVDAQGLELRCLAHFMHPFDDGEYAEAVVNGDVHTMNQHAAGLEKRSDAKTFIYAFL